MACFHPLPAWRSREDLKTMVFSSEKGIPGTFVYLPCGKCIGCKVEKARYWAMRCQHESSLYDFNYFVTLTYNDTYLPFDESLQPRDLTLFLKRLRKRFGSGIRFFACGEYGEKLSRPHYHLCLFNCNFPLDSFSPISVNKYGDILYTQVDLFYLWPFGYHTVGRLTAESAAYTALYTLKKQSSDFYGDKVEPFLRMSRRPGIGKGWYDKYAKFDIYSHYDGVVNYNGFVMRPPKYYDNQFKQQCPEQFDRIKERRRQSIIELEHTPERLAIKEHLLLHKIKRKTRSFHLDVESGVCPLPLKIDRDIEKFCNM